MRSNDLCRLSTLSFKRKDRRRKLVARFSAAQAPLKRQALQKGCSSRSVGDEAPMKAEAAG